MNQNLHRSIPENNEVYPDVAQVDSVELYAVENSTNHRTDKYELVQDDKTPVLRRADFFYLALKAQNRQLDLDSDEIKLVFDFGMALEFLFCLKMS